MSRRSARRFFGLLVTLCCLPGGAAQAQEPRVELSALQEQLLRDAVQESQRTDTEPDYQAMRLNYEAALQKGEADILYVGLARALYRQGLCFDAQEMLRRADGAPNSTLATRAQIQQQIQRYARDMEQTCPGAVQLTCADPAMEVVLAQAPVACGQRVELPPGQHSLRWSLGERQGAQQVTVRRLEVTALQVPSEGLRPDPILAPPALIPMEEPVAEEGPGALKVAGWSLVGAGALSLAAGGVAGLRVLALDGEAQDLGDQNRISAQEVSDLEADAELFEALQWAGLGVGAACTLTGLLLLWLDGPEEAAPAPVGVSLWGTHQDGGVLLRGRW